VEKACAIVMQDRRLTIRLLAECLGVGKEAATQILKRDLQKRKMCSRFVPHSLTDEQREHRVECCCRFIEFVDQDRDVLQRIVTAVESWFQFDPETKRQSMEWCGTNSPRQKKIRLKKSRVKTMLIVSFMLPELSTVSFFLKAPQSPVTII
jgi:hypothetical protein